MLSFKSVPTSATLQAQINDREKRIAEAETSVETAADAVLAGDNPQVLDAAIAHLEKLQADVKTDRSLHAAAVRREAAEAEAARTAEEKRVADAKARANQALYKGGQQVVAVEWRKPLALVPELAAQLAAIARKAAAATSNIANRVPPDAPYDRYYAHFGPAQIGRLIAGELARAFADVEDVDLGVGQAPDDELAATLKEIAGGVEDFLKRTIIDRDFRQVNPPILAPEPAPPKAPPRPYRRHVSEIEKIDLVQRTGWSRERVDQWFKDQWIEAGAEVPRVVVAQPAPRPADLGQERAGLQADAALDAALRSDTFANSRPRVAWDDSYEIARREMAAASRELDGASPLPLDRQKDKEVAAVISHQETEPETAEPAGMPHDEEI